MKFGIIVSIVLLIGCTVALYFFFVKPILNKDVKKQSKGTYQYTASTFKQDWEGALMKKDYSEMESLQAEYAIHHCTHRSAACINCCNRMLCPYFYPEGV